MGDRPARPERQNANQRHGPSEIQEKHHGYHRHFVEGNPTGVCHFQTRFRHAGGEQNHVRKRSAGFALTPTLERMKKRGFELQELVERLHEKGIEVKAPTLAKYLSEFKRRKERHTAPVSTGKMPEGIKRSAFENEHWQGSLSCLIGRLTNYKSLI